jgi:hypothetical protein
LNDPGDDARRQLRHFVLQLRELQAIGFRREIPACREHLGQLDEHAAKLLARATQVFRACAVASLVLDELVVGDADAALCEDGEDFAVAFALCDHCAMFLSGEPIDATRAAVWYAMLSATYGERGAPVLAVNAPSSL